MLDWYQVAIDNFGWKEITMWFFKGEYNHHENGHVEGDIPKPVCGQKWGESGWSKYFTYSTKDVCPKLFYP